MAQPETPIRTKWDMLLDRLGIALSGLCAVHCFGSLILVSLLGLGGGVLLSPRIHETGLVLAIVVGIVTLGYGSWHHRHLTPIWIGLPGLMLMGLALRTEHGALESGLTIAGVALVAVAHITNIRHKQRHNQRK